MSLNPVIKAIREIGAFLIEMIVIAVMVGGLVWCFLQTY